MGPNFSHHISLWPGSMMSIATPSNHQNRKSQTVFVGQRGPDGIHGHERLLDFTGIYGSPMSIYQFWHRRQLAFDAFTRYVVRRIVDRLTPTQDRADSLPNPACGL